MIRALRSIFQPYAIFMLMSLFLAFTNVFLPKYILAENDYLEFRFFFNMANIFGPLLLLGVDLSVGAIALEKIISFIKFYIIFIIMVIVALFFAESIYSPFDMRIIIGILCVSSIQLFASFFLKNGNTNKFYFLSQIYTKLVPLSVIISSLLIFEGFNLDLGLTAACFLLAIPFMVLTPKMLAYKEISPSIRVLTPKVVGMVFGTIVINTVIRLPYFLSLGNGDVSTTNIIDIVTVFTSVLLYPAMLFSRSVEISSKMEPKVFYDNVKSGYFSIGMLQLMLLSASVLALAVALFIGLISYEINGLIRIFSGLAFCSVVISIIPNFVKLYINKGFNRRKHNYIWLSMCVILSLIWWGGLVGDIMILTATFVIISFLIQYSIAIAWTGSYKSFLNYYSLGLSSICLMTFIYFS